MAILGEKETPVRALVDPWARGEAGHLVPGPEMGSWDVVRGYGASKQMACCVPALGGEGRAGGAAGVSAGWEEDPAWVRATPALGKTP